MKSSSHTLADPFALSKDMLRTLASSSLAFSLFLVSESRKQQAGFPGVTRNTLTPFEIAEVGRPGQVTTASAINIPVLHHQVCLGFSELICNREQLLPSKGGPLCAPGHSLEMCFLGSPLRSPERCGVHVPRPHSFILQLGNYSTKLASSQHFHHTRMASVLERCPFYFRILLPCRESFLYLQTWPFWVSTRARSASMAEVIKINLLKHGS